MNAAYATAQQEWNARYGRSMAALRAWRLTTIVALFGTLLIALVAVWRAGQTTTIPYVIRLDGLGQPISVARADGTAFPDPAIVRAQLASWLRDARSVSADPVIESAALARVYAQTGASAKPYLDGWYRNNSPFAAGATGTVAVTVGALTALTPTTYQIAWTQEQRDRDGAHPVDTAWEAQITVAVVPPANAALIVRNPLGLYITQLSWTQRV